MLDYRVKTFIVLCDTMNYRQAAETLNITQPGVTQHIQFLEKNYGCRFFNYDKRQLTKTRQGKIFEQYVRSEIYNEQQLYQSLKVPEKTPLRIGATKTIGNYVIYDKIINLAEKPDIDLSFHIDNTQNLLVQLDKNILDLAIVEGRFNKDQYNSQLFKLESFVGVCHSKHPFSGKEISIERLFEESLFIREKGSGTRNIFQQILQDCGYSLESFETKKCLNNFRLIKDCILKYNGITFAYKAFAESDPQLGNFSIKGLEVKREFNIVYLKHTEVNMQPAIASFLDEIRL